jgi:hypothetical protein
MVPCSCPALYVGCAPVEYSYLNGISGMGKIPQLRVGSPKSLAEMKLQRAPFAEKSVP